MDNPIHLTSALISLAGLSCDIKAARLYVRSLFSRDTNMNYNWRTIDIDQYDEDAYTEDEILASFESQMPADQAEALAQTQSTDVRNLLTR